VGTFGGFGQIPHAKVALQLHGIETGNGTGHDDSSVKRTGWGRFLPAWVHLSEAVGLTRRGAPRRPTPGREARKSPCQQLSHEYQASVPGDRRANEIAGAGSRARPPAAASPAGRDITGAQNNLMRTTAAAIDVDPVFVQSGGDVRAFAFLG
jgi:hypothetical protein